MTSYNMHEADLRLHIYVIETPGQVFVLLSKEVPFSAVINLDFLHKVISMFRHTYPACLWLTC